METYLVKFTLTFNPLISLLAVDATGWIHGYFRLDKDR